MQPASRVVAKLGGPTKVAKIVGIHRTRVSAWQRPRASGGTGGRIPQDHHARLLAFARENGVALAAEDLLDGGPR